MNGSNCTCVFTVIVGDIPAKEDAQNLLDDCVILNTYNSYFVRKKIFKNIQIACGMKCYDNRFEINLLERGRATGFSFKAWWMYQIRG